MDEQRWKAWSNRTATPENMVLNTDPIFYSADKDELLQYTPSIKGSSVLELGCGIGRFTGELSNMAHDVTAVDLIQEYIDVAKSTYGHLKNLKLVCSDIQKLDLPKGSFDMVFTSWIFGNHNERETKAVLNLVLYWLKPGGHLIFRESGPDSYVLKVGHPANYRTAGLYEQILKDVINDGYTLSITRCRNSLTYIRLLQDVHQVYYVTQKVPVQPSIAKPIAPAVPAPKRPLPTMKEQDMKGAGAVAGNCVLVLGCGTGGLVLHLATKYHASVTGVCSSVAEINTAIHRQHLLPRDIIRLVQYEMIDSQEATFDDNSFNLILVRDTELRTPQQYQLLPKLRRWMRPGGKMYIIDDTTYQDKQPTVEARDMLTIGLKDETAQKPK